MMNRKNFFKIISNLIILLSLFFLVIYLVRHQQLVFLEIKNYYFLLISVFFLLTGFLADGFSLMVFLNKNSIVFNYKNAVVNTGKFILAKYIPGKIGVLIGKASHLTEISQISPVIALQKIFLYQLFALTSALLISIIPLYTFLNTGTNYLIWIILIIFTGVIFLSQKKVQGFILKSAERISKKNMGAPIEPTVVIISLMIIMSVWLSWSLGFYFLAKSLGFYVQLNIGFLFPLAALAGILALISPGGLGIREGIIAAGLIYYGLPEESAISISAFSRLWYLCGELFIFIIAIFLSINKKNQIRIPDKSMAKQ